MEETRVITVDKYDYKLMLNALNEFRIAKMNENIDIGIIDELIMKIYNAPVKRTLSLNRKTKGRYTIEGR